MQNQQMPIITQNMIDHLFDDNSTIKSSKLPSNLVEIPKVNEKYEISSFYGSHPTFNQILATNKLLKNLNSDNEYQNVNAMFFS